MQMGSGKAESKSGLLASSIELEQSTKPSTANSAPALLLEIVTIVSQISQLDSMSEKIKSSAPEEGSEADKWHKVSVQAVETSRKYMVEQQTSLFQRLAIITGTPLSKQSGNVAHNTEKEDAPVTPPPSPPGLLMSPPPGLEMASDKACD